MEIRKVKMTDLKMGPIRDQVLPAGFIERVQKYKAILAEVEKTSLEDTVANFMRDLTPESELLIWEHIAKIYKWAIVAYPSLSLNAKKDAYSILVGLSLDTNKDDFGNIKNLSKETIDEIVDRYQYE